MTTHLAKLLATIALCATLAWAVASVLDSALTVSIGSAL